MFASRHGDAPRPRRQRGQRPDRPARDGHAQPPVAALPRRGRGTGRATGNVTAVDWTGASFRGEGLAASSAYDPASFTAERCAAAIRAGVAAVLNDLTGIVIWLDEG